MIIDHHQYILVSINDDGDLLKFEVSLFNLCVDVDGFEHNVSRTNILMVLKVVPKRENEDSTSSSKNKGSAHPNGIKSFSLSQLVVQVVYTLLRKHVHYV